MSLRDRFSGQELRRIRKEAGYTQAEMAVRVGISRETVIAIENEHPGAINSLELGVLKLWWKACHQRVTQETKTGFVTYIQSFFNF
ncbi:helix-turn-helix domain-containing protein [Alteromonadaceae bacterium M269]|nr:helix-turn-helix domain-containing protein [Alteromonadaceae bacterium M269]